LSEAQEGILMKIEPNNFDSIRLFAALAVVFSHAFPITCGSDDCEPLHRFSNGQTTIGTIAVGVFFVISGFLITRSFELGQHDLRGALRFVRARALRIFPALFVTLLLLSFALGPILSTLSVREYFGHSQVLSFFLVNVSLSSFHDGLPGVFSHNPFANSVNGSLWTLRYEVRCYALIFVLGILRLITSSVLAILFLAALGVFAFLGHESWFLAAFFLGGAFLYVRPLPLDGRIAAVCAGIIILSLCIGGFQMIAPIFGTYLVMWLALSDSVRLPRVAKYGDYSYGIYIYAFPVQQMVAQFMAAGGTWYWNVLISGPISIILGVLSWILIERPALALKGWPSGSSMPVSARQ
jgi:peptidoglycan/LPS O-acetylase OafA/YrhL